MERTLPNLFSTKQASSWRKAGFQAEAQAQPSAQVTQAAQNQDEFVKWDQKRQEQEMKAEQQQQKAEAKRDLDARKKLLELKGLSADILAEDGSIDELAVVKQVMANLANRNKAKADVATKKVVKKIQHQGKKEVEHLKAKGRLDERYLDVQDQAEQARVENDYEHQWKKQTRWKTLKGHRKQVERLQEKILHHYKERNDEVVRRLQDTLTQSISARILAVHGTTNSSGSDTPGVDGVTWKTNTAKWEAVQALSEQGYQAKPLRRIEVPKPGSNKKRPIGIPTMIDRAKQALYLTALDPIAEETADPNSYGFRKHRSTHDALEQARTVFSGKDSPEWILDADIQGCFDNIDHDWLLRNIPLSKSILREWIKCGHMDRKQVLHYTTKGTPQGGKISPCLSNMTLDGLEKVVNTATGPGKKCKFIRYADDFIIGAYEKSTLEEHIRPAVEKFLSERGLNLSDSKTSTRHIGEGVDFLGQHVRKINGRVKITPSAKNVSNILAKAKEIIANPEVRSLETLLVKLNPVIKGWANYHSYVEAKEQYANVDARVHEMVLRFLYRLHTDESTESIKFKYLVKIQDMPGGGTFQVPNKEREGDNPEHSRLFKASSINKIPYIKIKAKANPYSNGDRAYFKDLFSKRKSIKTDRNKTDKCERGSEQSTALQ